MPRTKSIDADHYEAIVHDLLIRHERRIFEKDISNRNWGSELDSIVRHAWHNGDFLDYTYDSIAQCVTVNSPEEVASHNPPYNDGAGVVLDDITFKYVSQDIWERFDDKRTVLLLINVIYDCFDDLLSDPQLGPSALRQDFDRWFTTERMNGETPAANLDSLPDDAFTPAHITQDTLLESSQTTLLSALHWWLKTNYLDSYESNTTDLKDDLSINPH